jgi:TolB-like protein
MRTRQFLIIFLPILAGYKAYSIDSTVIPRRVLILPLVNVTHSKEHDWMRQSLADNLKTQLIKSKKFSVLDALTATEIFPDIRMDNLSHAEAVKLAKRLNCEIVTQGRFIVQGGRFRLEMEAADANTGNALSAEKADGKLDGSMFTTIDTVVETLTADMVAKAPPLPTSEVHRDTEIENKLNARATVAPPLPATKHPVVEKSLAQESLSLPARRPYNLNAYLSFGIPISKISDHIGVNFGARATIWRNLLFRWLNPMVVADAFYSRGQDVNGMFFYFAGAGITYSIATFHKLNVMPFAAFGVSGGRLYYQEGFNFIIGALDTGFSAEYALTEKWRLAASISYRHVFDKYVAGSFLQTYWGVGYVF